MKNGVPLWEKVLRDGRCKMVSARDIGSIARAPRRTCSSSVAM